jgi:hypothetical protein
MAKNLQLMNLFFTQDNSWGSKWYIKAEAYPKDNPTIKTPVFRLSDGRSDDDYLLKYGMYEANTKMQNILDETYGKNIAYPGVSCDFIHADRYKQKWGRTPTLD